MIVAHEHESILGRFISYPLLAADLFGESSMAAIASRHTNARSRYFEADEIVVKSGDHPLIVVLLQGRARLSIFNHIDNKMLTTEFSSDQIVGVSETLANHSLEFSVKTITPCKFYLIAPDNFIGLLAKKPEICFRLFELLSGQLHASYQTFSSTEF